MTGEDINARVAALVPFEDTLANLAAKNSAYLKGQIVWVNDDGRIGMKKGDWDWKHQAYEAATKFNDLEWIITPAASGGGRLNTFFFNNTDPARYAALPDGSGFTIIDNRLRGKQDYPIFATTTGGGVLRDDQVSYNGVAGTATITGFTLDDQQTVWVVIPTGISADPDYVAMDRRVVRLERFLAPILKGGTIFTWNRPLADIPDDYQEVTDFEGKMLVHIDTAKTAFNAIGKTGGATEVKLAQKNIPLFVLANGEYKNLVKYVDGGVGGAAATDDTQAPGDKQFNLLNCGEIQNPGTPAAEMEAVQLMNPFRIVAYIEPKPELLTLYPFI